MKRFAFLFVFLALAGSPALAQQSVTPVIPGPVGHGTHEPGTGLQKPEPAPAPAVPRTPPAAASPAAPIGPLAPAPEFFRTADEVLKTMSQILDLPIVSPLKKSVRTRAEIHAYLVQQMKDDEDPAKRYADRRSLEAFGLIPKGFPLDQFMLDLLTQQIAGLYDPKAQEFYIADWIPPSEQRIVMAHELTHALDDQHFHIEQWLKAARPNDDAELAREAVVEGSAVASMIDYDLHSLGRSVRDLPDISPLVALTVGEADRSPGLDKAPPFIRDALIFPYLPGAVFTQQVLQAGSGWADFQKVFARPPVSTQQILHPKLYLENVDPVAVSLPPLSKILSRDWNELEENVLGEFGLEEVLKQFLGGREADEIAPGWTGDRYAVFEQQPSKRLLLVFLVRFANSRDAAAYFSADGRALVKKYPDRREEFSAEEFLRFATADGGVFLRCRADECLSVEGASAKTFDRINHALRWPRPPRASAHPDSVAQALLPRTALVRGLPMPATSRSGSVAQALSPARAVN
jgi:hypothetical protein